MEPSYSYRGEQRKAYLRSGEKGGSMLSEIQIAERRLEIVRMRNLAAWQRGEYAESHRQQADHPIYPGQGEICISKAMQAERLAAENEAKADLMEAQLNADIAT
jgi:hypothetical protein